MKTYYVIILLALVSCKNASKDTSESTETKSVNEASDQRGLDRQFKGEYLVGDGGYFITPVENAWEMRNAPQSEPVLLYFDKIENDTVSVYATKDRSIIFRMYPNSDFGMYYENAERWPVSRMVTSEAASMEEKSPEEILQDRHEEDEKAFSELDKYDGVYAIRTESEGVSASLKLKYKGDRVFSFELSLEVPDVCKGSIKDEFTMDRTQHGFYDRQGCILHFNLVDGQVEIDEPEGCTLMKGECTFSSTWARAE